MTRILLLILPLLLLATGVKTARADDPKELKVIEARLDKAKLASDETLRQKYIMELAMLRFHLSHGDSLDWQLVEAEMAKHPAPTSSDSEAFRKLRLGIWYSPRHSYLYRADGTWVMDPDNKDAPLSEHTHGTWSIKGNQYTDGTSEQSDTYTIILLTKDNFIFTPPAFSDVIPQLFFERRTETGGMPIMRDDPASAIPK